VDEFDLPTEAFLQVRGALLLRGRLLRVFHLKSELLTQLQRKRGQSPEPSLFLRLLGLQPPVFRALTQTHSLCLLFQQPTHEILGEGAVFPPRFVVVADFAFEDLGNGVGVVLGLKGSAAGDQFEDSDSQGPNVHSLVVPSAKVDLGGEVEVGADDSQHVSAHSPRESLLRDAEVHDFEFACLLVVENVLGFDVPVADVVPVQVLQPRDQLPHHCFELPLGLRAALLKVREGEVFHH